MSKGSGPKARIVESEASRGAQVVGMAVPKDLSTSVGVSLAGKDVDSCGFRTSDARPTGLRGQAEATAKGSTKVKDYDSKRVMPSLPDPRWFGASRVVDCDGNPLRVYHGTGKQFSAFKVVDCANVSGAFYFASTHKLNTLTIMNEPC